MVLLDYTGFLFARFRKKKYFRKNHVEKYSSLQKKTLNDFLLPKTQPT